MIKKMNEILDNISYGSFKDADIKTIDLTIDKLNVLLKYMKYYSDRKDFEDSDIYIIYGCELIDYKTECNNDSVFNSYKDKIVSFYKNHIRLFDYDSNYRSFKNPLYNKPFTNLGINTSNVFTGKEFGTYLNIEKTLIRFENVCIEDNEISKMEITLKLKNIDDVINEKFIEGFELWKLK